MIVRHEPSDIVRRLVHWAEQRDAVRALLLAGSRTNRDARVDVFSDYDILLLVADIRPFFTDRTWLSEFGQILVAYWDPIEPDPEYGIDQTGNVTYYRDGLHIDFTIRPVALVQRIAQSPVLPAGLDAGYSVLLDKDGIPQRLGPPTHRAYIPSRPTAEAYQTWIEEFFSDAPYVAKCLWRDELLPARWCIDFSMKHKYLIQMLEWRMEGDHGWSVSAGNLGRGLKKRLPAAIWSRLEHTYVGAAIEDNWESLFETLALFRQTAIEVAQDLGYTYPHELDRQVTAFVREMKARQRQTDG